MAITDEEIERYAAVRAALDLRTDPAMVLRERGHEPEAWSAFEANVIEELAAQIDRGETRGLMTFRGAYRVNVEAPPLPLPSSLADPAPQALGPPPAQGDVSVLVPLRSAAEPATTAPVAAAPAPIAQQAPPARPLSLSHTTIAPDNDVIQSLLRGSALPFGREAGRLSASPSVPLPTPRAPDPAFSSPGPTRPPTHLAETALLPSGAEIEAAVALVKRRQQAHREAEPGAPRPDPRRDAALPFVAPRLEEAQVPMLLERYAEISATLESEGNPMTFERVGVTPESWRAVVRTYADLFAKDRALEARFEALMRTYRGRAR